MKEKLAIVIFFIAFKIFPQSDTIFTIKGDTILCRFSFFTSNKVHYVKDGFRETMKIVEIKRLGFFKGVEPDNKVSVVPKKTETFSLDSFSLKKICITNKPGFFYPKRVLMLDCKERISHKDFAALCIEEFPKELATPIFKYNRTAAARRVCVTLGIAGLVVSTGLLIETVLYSLNNCLFGCSAGVNQIIERKQAIVNVTGVCSLALFPTAFVLNKRKRYIAEILMVDEYNNFYKATNGQK